MFLRFTTKSWDIECESAKHMNTYMHLKFILNHGDTVYLREKKQKTISFLNPIDQIVSHAA